MPSSPVFFAAIVLGAAISMGCSQKAPKEDAPSDPLGDLAGPASPNIELPPRATATTLRVLIGGDVLPHRPRLLEPARIHAALEPLAPFFQSSDAVVVNFEAATGDPDHATKMAYVAPPEWLGALKESGVTAITAANNHSCDMGQMGVRTTLASSSAAGLTAIGVDSASAPFTYRVIAEKNGKKVCAVAWTNLMNSHSCDGSTLVAYAPATRRGTAQIVSAVIKARESCDAVIAIFHGGAEYAPQTEAMIAQATRAADAGADAVIMHHPHIVSPMTKHTTKDGRTVPIFASLGNLVTNQGESWKPPMFPVLRTDRHLVCVNGWTRLGMLADLAFSFSGTHKALSYASHLVYIQNEHANDKAAKMPKIDVRMLSPEGDKDVIARLRDDKVGPVPVFDDPCWFEGSGKRCDADVDAKSKTTPSDDPMASAGPDADDEEPGAAGSPRSHRLTAAHVSTRTKSHKKP